MLRQVYCLSPQPYLDLAIALPTVRAPLGVLAFSTNFKALIAPAMVEGVTRLLVGTLVEISKAGVGCCSATTGAESIGAGASAESTGWDVWAGSTLKFAGGVREEVVAEEVELTETS